MGFWAFLHQVFAPIKTKILPVFKNKARQLDRHFIVSSNDLLIALSYFRLGCTLMMSQFTPGCTSAALLQTNTANKSSRVRGSC
jgi:hypothetical protein